MFIDHRRTDAYPQSVAERVKQTVSFLSAVVQMELRLGADSPNCIRPVDAIRAAFPPERILAPSAPLFNRAAQVFQNCTETEAAFLTDSARSTTC